MIFPLSLLFLFFLFGYVEKGNMEEEEEEEGGGSVTAEGPEGRLAMYGV